MASRDRLRYTDAATRGAQHVGTTPGGRPAGTAQPVASAAETGTAPAALLRRRPWRQAGILAARRVAASARGRIRGGAASAEVRRAQFDVRLVPAVIGSWAAAWIGIRIGPLPALSAGQTMTAIGCGIGGVAALASSSATASVDGDHHQRLMRQRGWPAVALTLLCIGAVLLAAGFKGDSRTSGPVGAVIAQSGTVTATLTVTGEPRPVATERPAFGSGARFYLTAVVTEATAKGQRFGANTPVILIGGSSWVKVETGDRVATAGKLVPGQDGQDAAALFLAAGAPHILPGQRGWAQWSADLRSSWRRACGWLWPDAAGLLPGMTVGDRTAIPADLDAAMKRVGLTHLTAVSGANCTLILGGLLFAARSLRMPRALAAAAAGAGLAAFVALVGPDPSVLRAAVMGLIGLSALLSGRPRHIPALLALTIVVLLAVDPWLSGSFAFILSVLATLGLVLLGKPCARWLSTCLPHWAAQAVAVPLAAQLFCAPVIVLLQPQLTLYSLPANIAAAPVVALVTVAGTLGLPALLLTPWATPVFVATAGLGAQWVALTARFFSGLPGAAIPWPEGAGGVALMTLLSVLTVTALWALLNYRRVAGTASAARAHLPARWQAAAGLPAVAAGAAALTALTVWVVSQTGQT